jgi:hypothetical protein
MEATKECMNTPLATGVGSGLHANNREWDAGKGAASIGGLLISSRGTMSLISMGLFLAQSWRRTLSIQLQWPTLLRLKTTNYIGEICVYHFRRTLYKGRKLPEGAANKSILPG